MRIALFIFTLLFVLAASASAQIYPFPGGRVLPAINQRAITDQYRKPTKEELEALKVNAGDVERFAAFLRQPRTGLIKFAADLKCADNTKVVVVTPDCLKYTMPGGGAAYSFRVRNYRTQRLADLTFSDNGFLATGVLLHGLLTRIGDVPLEQVGLQTKGLKYLVEFKPVTDYDEAQKIAQKLVEGVESDGFLYRRGLNAYENATYVLRSVAYDGEFNRAIDGVTYNELDFDERKDIIVAFRIVRREKNGGVTILWKQLAEKDSPKIKRGKEGNKNE